MIEAIRDILFGLACLICVVLFVMIGRTEWGINIYAISFVIFLAYVIGVNWRNRKE